MTGHIDFIIDPKALGERLLERLDAMRRASPVYWSARNGAWLVTGHAEVEAGYSGRLPLSSRRLPGPAMVAIPEERRRALFPLVMQAPESWLLNMDDPGHARLRKLMARAFNRDLVERMRPHARRFITETLDRVGQYGGEPFDFVSEIAQQIPTRVILLLLGLPEALMGRMHYWSEVMNRVGNLHVSEQALVEVNDVLAEVRALLVPEWQRRRLNPRQDFLSALVTASEDGDRLSEDEMFGICTIMITGGGHDTTTNTMALGTAALARDSRAVKLLREQPDIIGNAVMELQRQIAMSTVMSRRVARDFEWHGQQLRENDVVLLFQAAANHDPALFPEPGTLDFMRPQHRNLTFAPGLHHCIGHLLAKMQLAEFFPELFGRFDVELLDRSLAFSPLMSFRGLEYLNIRLRPRPH